MYYVNYEGKKKSTNAHHEYYLSNEELEREN
jgi:hypothetical protein